MPRAQDTRSFQNEEAGPDGQAEVLRTLRTRGSFRVAPFDFDDRKPFLTDVADFTWRHVPPDGNVNVHDILRRPV